MADAQVQNTEVIRVLVGIPNEGNTLVDAYDNRMLLFQHWGGLEIASKLGVTELNGTEFMFPLGKSFEFALATVGNVLTPIARQRIAEIAVDSGFDFLLFVDDDMICPVSLFEELFQHRKDIVGALAFTRFAPHKPVIYQMDEGFDSISNQNYYTCRSWLNYPRNQLVECDAVGFGAVLIKVDVFKTMPKPWFTAATGKGEDIQFCYEAGKAGYKVYMDTACKLGHLGPPRNITEEVFDAQNGTQGEEEHYARVNGTEYGK